MVCLHGFTWFVDTVEDHKGRHSLGNSLSPMCQGFSFQITHAELHDKKCIFIFQCCFNLIMNLKISQAKQ